MTTEEWEVKFASFAFSDKAKFDMFETTTRQEEKEPHQLTTIKKRAG